MVTGQDGDNSLVVFWNSTDGEGNTIGHKVSYSCEYVTFNGDTESLLPFYDLSDQDQDTLENMFTYIENMYCRNSILDKFC
jgi:hypothetical protein